MYYFHYVEVAFSFCYRNGSNLTPAHRVGEFRFKTYAPVAFRYFRELFGIQTDDFLVSITEHRLMGYGLFLKIVLVSYVV